MGYVFCFVLFAYAISFIHGMALSFRNKALVKENGKLIEENLGLKKILGPQTDQGVFRTPQSPRVFIDDRNVAKIPQVAREAIEGLLKRGKETMSNEEAAKAIRDFLADDDSAKTIKYHEDRIRNLEFRNGINLANTGPR